jgi:hypothetical protein
MREIRLPFGEKGFQITQFILKEAFHNLKIV